jgi:poly-beta-1,6-N-acetyl-D-glucosamine synthase
MKTNLQFQYLEEDLVSPSGPAAVASYTYLDSGRFYLTVRSKFFIINLIAVLWGCLSYYLARRWIDELALHITLPISYMVVFSIAIIPGYMNAFLVAALLFDKRPKRFALTEPYPPLSILIAAYKEEVNILATIESIAKQNYPGVLQVIVINDGSPDNTASLVRQAMMALPTKRQTW